MMAKIRDLMRQKSGDGCMADSWAFLVSFLIGKLGWLCV
jgi:hypothetical protein